MGVHFFPSKTGGDNLLGTGGRGCPGHPAYRRRQVALLPGTYYDEGGTGGGGVAAHIADQGPGTESQGQGHQGYGRTFGHDPQGDRHRAGQRSVRRLQVPVSVAGETAYGPVPDQGAEDAGLLSGSGRGALHLPVGLRFQAGLPADIKYQGTASRCACDSAYCDGHSGCREGYRGEARLQEGQYHLFRV